MSKAVTPNYTRETADKSSASPAVVIDWPAPDSTTEASGTAKAPLTRMSEWPKTHYLAERMHQDDLAVRVSVEPCYFKKSRRYVPPSLWRGYEKARKLFLEQQLYSPNYLVHLGELHQVKKKEADRARYLVQKYGFVERVRQSTAFGLNVGQFNQMALDEVFFLTPLPLTYFATYTTSIGFWEGRGRGRPAADEEGGEGEDERSSGLEIPLISVSFLPNLVFKVFVTDA